jgi:PAS domain S-box-containing protein
MRVKEMRQFKQEDLTAADADQACACAKKSRGLAIYSDRGDGVMEHQLASSRAAGGAVAEGEAKFRALMESASQAIVAVNHKGLIEVVNHKVEELFGYTDDELIGHSLEMLLPEALREQHAGHRKDYFSRPKVRPMGIGLNLAGRRKNGQEFPIEISLNYVEVGGHSLTMR